MSFIVLVTILLFTSCAKETLILNETDNLQNVIEQDADFKETSVSYITEIEDNETSNKSYITLVLQASVTSVSQTGGEYIVDLAVNHDCTNSAVVTNQTVDFIKANGKTVSLAFQVNSYTGSNGALQVALDLSGHNLSGLTLKTAQDIVIEEQVIN